MKILLIEDDCADAELVRGAMRKAGEYATLVWEETFASGHERLCDERFDLILSDLSLADCNGRETVDRLREAAHDTPIVVLTDLDDDGVDRQLREAGAEDYLVKGELTGSGLKRAIRHALQRHEHRCRIRDLLCEVEAKNDLLAKKNAKLAKLFDQAHEFVDNVSHEFRTPLTVIKEYISLVREGYAGEVTAEQSRLLNVAEDRADDMNIMVDDMLDVSKLEAGMLGAWRKNCHIEDVVDRVRDSLQRKAATKNVELIWEVDKDLPELYCDAEKAGRVLTNLAINAIKFCGDQGVVRIVANLNHESREVSVAVIDNGPGIESNSLSLIFQRFKQQGQTVKSSTKGFGLGLGIANDLVELNFGEMDVRSELGTGSTFTFSLPLAEPMEILKRYLKRIQKVECDIAGDHRVSVVEAGIATETKRSISDDVDAFLNYCLRANDLLFRISPTRWVVVMPETKIEVQAYFTRMNRELDSVNRNRPFGPLPGIETALAGTWDPCVHQSEVLEKVRTIIHNLEVNLELATM